MAGGSVSETTLHASCVAFQNRGVLILGASGTGKSALALQLMAMGAELIADDRTCLTRHGTQVVASAPERLHGLIEARGIGILTATPAPPAPVGLLVDLDHTEHNRLPDFATEEVLGVSVPRLHKVDNALFPAAVLQYLKGGLWNQM